MLVNVRIQTDDFSLGDEESILSANLKNAGALVAFVGKVRAHDAEIPLSHLFLEHYPIVTENEITRIIHLAAKRWEVEACTVIHRVGNLYPQENIVLVLAAGTHRKEAFAFAEYVMDYLKTEAPFWKQEHLSDGSSTWVAAKASDDEAKNSWQDEP